MNNGVISENELLLDINQLQQRFIMLNKQGITKLKVTENFQKYGERSFVVHNLKMDLEKEFVVCYDKHSILLNNYSVLCMFLKDQLTKIEVIPYVIQNLEFEGYGTITIEMVV